MAYTEVFEDCTLKLRGKISNRPEKAPSRLFELVEADVITGRPGGEE
jgi:hypothetical protein